MYRSNVRISRALIAVLAITLILGVALAINKLTKNKSGPAPAIAQHEKPAKPTITVPPVSEPVVIVTPPVNQPMPPATRSAPPATQVAARPPIVQPPPRATPATLAEGKAKMDAGELVAARRVLTDAMASGRLTDADSAAARQLLLTIGQTLVFSKKQFADDPYSSSYHVQSGEKLMTIAGKYDVTAGLLCRVNGISDPKRLQAGATIKVIKGPFHAVVSRSKFTIDMYLGNPAEKNAVLVVSYPVGLGKDDSTPVGLWQVQKDSKITNPKFHPSESARAAGYTVMERDDPKNPLGEYWIGLAGVEGDAKDRTGYGIHGTIEPQSIGKKESLGCIRMLNDDIAAVFDMLIEVKSTVIVKD